MREPTLNKKRPFPLDALSLDTGRVVETIGDTIRRQVLETLRRKGLVVGLSGGIDSSVVAALAARALGPERVLALLMPDRDSSPESIRLGRMMAEAIGVEVLIEDLGKTAEAVGCYRRQVEAIRKVFPEYELGWKCKLIRPSILDGNHMPVFHLMVESPAGEIRKSRMPARAYTALVAATNFKQRLRKMMEYYHADRLLYAVAGTPNRLEYDQGFFVKQGDGAADVKPIAHLYKTQVYALAAALDVPEEIRARPPTTDTFSMPQTQEEFYFSLPYEAMDLCLYGLNHGYAPAEVADALSLAPAQVERVYQDIAAKRKATRYLHTRPLLIERVPEIHVTDEGD